jgi:uncharacterized protein YcfL
MKNYLFLSLFILFFQGCSSKIQDSVTKSTIEDNTYLIEKLIQKEKEINELNKKLEECEKN